MKNFICKRGIIIWFIIAIIGVSACYSKIVEISASKFNGITIVIDAGHGGRDGGSVGINGTVEKEINLEYAICLKNKLVENGYRVVMTRTSDEGLYSPLAKNKKQSDMNARMKIIKQANPNLVISIHMNSFPSQSAQGANTFYRKDDEASNRCADLIQKSISTYCNAKNIKGKEGDYFLVNCSYYTAVLIECGFISNEREESLLNTEEYKHRFTDAVFNGILLYFGNARI